MIGSETIMAMKNTAGEEGADEIISLVDEMTALANGNLLATFLLFQYCVLVTVGRTELNSDDYIGVTLYPPMSLLSALVKASPAKK